MARATQQTRQVVGYRNVLDTQVGGILEVPVRRGHEVVVGIGRVDARDVRIAVLGRPGVEDFHRAVEVLVGLVQVGELGGVEGLRTGGTLEHHAERKVLPGEAGRQGEGHLRHVAAQVLAVVVVDVAVAVVVDELQVAGLGVGLDAVAVLVDVGGGLLVALEDTVGLHEPERVERLALGRAVEVLQLLETAVVGPHGLRAVLVGHADVRNPVLQDREVTADEVAPVLVDLLFPRSRELDAAVADLAQVDRRGAQTHGVGPARGLRLDQVVGALHEEVGRHREASAEHVEIQTQVGLLGGLPGEVVVAGDGIDAVAVGRGVDLPRTVALAVDAQRGGAVGVADRTEVADAAPRCAQLEQRHDVVLGEEGLARNLPAAGYRGEVGTLAALGQTTGIVAAPRSGHEITVVEAVRQTGHQGDVVVGSVVAVGRIHVLGSLVEVLVHLALVLEAGGLDRERAAALLAGGGTHQGAHGVLAEGVVVGQHVLGLPVPEVGGAVLQAVGQVGLTRLGTHRIEALVEKVLVAVGEAAVERKDVGDGQVGRRRDLLTLVLLGVALEDAQRADQVAEDAREVGIELRHAAERTVVVVGTGAAGEHHGVEDHTLLAAVGVRAALLVVGVHEVLRDGDPVVELVAAVVADAGGLVEGALERTLLVVVVERHTVGEALRTALHRNLVALVEGRAEDLADPVGLGVQLGQVPLRGERGAVDGQRLATDLALLLEGERLRQVGGLAHAVVAFVGDRGLAGLGLLGRHEDNAGGTRLGAVDGGRGGILQHDDRLDVVHVERSARNAVDHPQHALARLRSDTADRHRGSRRRVAALGDDRHARHLTLEHALGRGHRTGLVALHVVEHAHRGRQVGLTRGGTETEDHDILQHGGVLLEHDVEVGRSRRYGDRLALVADERHLEGALLARNVDREGARRVGRSTRSRPPDDHAGADYRSVLVGHGTRNLETLCEQAHRHREQYHEQHT